MLFAFVGIHKDKDWSKLPTCVTEVAVKLDSSEGRKLKEFLPFGDCVKACVSKLRAGLCIFDHSSKQYRYFRSCT